MKKISTLGIVLSRKNYGEADKIIIFLTPDYGKQHVIAKGVRKQKSKLAGGVEMFCVSEVSLIFGRSELKTLVSTRLKDHFYSIVKDLERSTVAYEIIKIVDKTSDDHPGPEYFDITLNTLKAIDNLENNLTKVELWFYAHLLWLEGHAPNLASDSIGDPLNPEKIYNFDYEAMAFLPHGSGNFNASHIKLLRIAIGKNPQLLQKVETDGLKVTQTLQLLKSIFSYRK